MKLLLTAFDPFGGDPLNPALEAVKLVKPTIGGVTVVKQEIPTVFRKSVDVMAAAIEREKPDVVLSIGLAAGRFEITPERVAINCDDARIKDNAGNQPLGSIFSDGENAYFSTLPIKAMTTAIRAVGIPSSISNTAGTFVCNHIFYGTMYTLVKKYPGIRGGFMHVPSTPDLTVGKNPPVPSLSLADIVRGIEAAIGAIEAYTGKEDLQVIGGQIA